MYTVSAEKKSDAPPFLGEKIDADAPSPFTPSLLDPFKNCFLLPLPIFLPPAIPVHPDLEAAQVLERGGPAKGGGRSFVNGKWADSFRQLLERGGVECEVLQSEEELDARAAEKLM
jgi:hypothetical protein